MPSLDAASIGRAARRVGALAGSCHPGPTAAVSLASFAYALRIGRGPAGALAAGAAVLAGQCTIGWHNDVLDAVRDAGVGRRDKPVARGAISRGAVALAGVVSGAATVPLSLLSGWRAGLAHLVAVALALAYNARLKAGPWSFVPYVLSFGLLPCFLTLGLRGSPLPPWWIPLGCATLGLAAHFANVLPDLDDDRVAGVVGLPHRLGHRTNRFVLAGSLVLAAGLLGALPGLHPAGGPTSLDATPLGAGAAAVVGVTALGLSVAGALAACAVAERRPRSRSPFGLVVLVAMLDVSLLLLRV